MVRLAEEGVDPLGLSPREEFVHVLMGGVDSGDWLLHPERPQILLGTQDMLLSRALMRGYASSRAVWPMEFAMLHQDAQWVFDEVQLMGAGRATSAQLEAFRRQERLRETESSCKTRCASRSLWISATLDPQWLQTVDHPAPARVVRVDPTEEEDPELLKLAEAPKRFRRAKFGPESASAKDERTYVANLASFVVERHRSDCLTLVIVNQVKRAQALFTRVQKLLVRSAEQSPRLALVHSRFRPADRRRETSKIYAGIKDSSDLICIATQAVEAGVDISAAVLITELAPWASMVQRFGRANRRAEVEGGAEVYWIDLLEHVAGNEKAAEKRAETLSRPYAAQELRESRERCAELRDVAPIHLPAPSPIAPSRRVIRRADLASLFDTDPDLTGFDVDISPYVRDAEDTDVRVFWRTLPISVDQPPKPDSDELCAVPIGQARKWIKGSRKAIKGGFFVRDPQWRPRAGGGGSNPPGWVPFRGEAWPGLTLLADTKAGGYRSELGFTGIRKHVPKVLEQLPSPLELASGVHTARAGESDGLDGDPRSEASRPIHLKDHLRHVAEESSALAKAVGLNEASRSLLTRAARWHDLGKAHEVFQDTMRRGLTEAFDVPAGVLLAKTVTRGLRHKRAYFRHELASALAFLAHEDWSRDADLPAFLIAAHHGKVRMNLRAVPRERPPKEPANATVRFARGIWKGDDLPPLALGGMEDWKGGSLSLSAMELGWDPATKESWTERTRELLAQLGPFRLSWLETILRVADWRASAKEDRGAYSDAEK